MFEKIKTWVEGNKTAAIVIGAIVALFALQKLAKKTYRRRRRVSAAPRRRTAARRRYTKGGKAKKPWQIKGSRAAKLRMARLRRLAGKRR